MCIRDRGVVVGLMAIDVVLVGPAVGVKLKQAGVFGIDPDDNKGHGSS